MPKQTFWGGNHPLKETYRALSVQLVPDYGRSDTVQGELIRAATRINYDWFNNGWGCNNWSGAVLFIKQYASELPVKLAKEDLVLLHNSLNECHGQSHGEPMHMDADYTSDLCTTVMELVLKLVISNPEPVSNTVDMFDLSEESYSTHSDDDDDDDWY